MPDSRRTQTFSPQPHVQVKSISAMIASYSKGEKPPWLVIFPSPLRESVPANANFYSGEWAFQFPTIKYNTNLEAFGKGLGQNPSVARSTPKNDPWQLRHG
jgi:hypothetical protein